MAWQGFCKRRLARLPLSFGGYCMSPKSLFGSSFGYADPEASLTIIKLGRDPLASNVFFHD